MLPVFDLHCDLLAYLTAIDGADPMGDEIGCSLPSLEEGNVKFQTLAIFTMTGEGSVESGAEQVMAFSELLEDYDAYVQALDDRNDLENIAESDFTTVVTAIENASGFCGEEDDLDEAFKTFETMLETIAPLLYISLTHNEENRFGGGNLSNNVGLKADGRVLLDYLSERRIAIDLSHTSDELARDIIDYTYAQGLNIPIIASHSNFRTIRDHIRNLPDDIAQEVIARGGLIGMNFCHEFIDEFDSDVLVQHILHGFELGGANAMAFGSDFFFSPDDAEFFYDHRNSAQFPNILTQLDSVLSQEQLHALSYGNALHFMNRLWR